MTTFFTRDDTPADAGASDTQGERHALAALVGADYSARAITAQRSDHAPNVVRQALARFHPWDAAGQIDLAQRGFVVDLGDAGAIRASTWDDGFESLRAAMSRALDRAPFVVALGGDHSVSWPLIDACAADTRQRLGAEARLGVVQLDVHHDVRSLRDGPSNGTPFRGLIEQGVIRGRDLMQIGIHPFANAAEPASWAREHGIHCLGVDDVLSAGAVATAMSARELLRDVDELYVSVDIDVLDRAFAPGTAAAMSGGLTPALVTGLVAELCADPRVRALDVVEFDPERDVAGITASAVANVVMTAISSAARRIVGAPH